MTAALCCLTISVMAQTAADLRKIIKLAKKEGLKSLKFGDIHLEFHSTQSIPPPATHPAVPLSGVPLDTDSEKIPGDDVMLYAATPFYDELVAQRDKKAV